LALSDSGTIVSCGCQAFLRPQEGGFEPEPESGRKQK
jgi:hypothetical protein